MPARKTAGTAAKKRSTAKKKAAPAKRRAAKPPAAKKEAAPKKRRAARPPAEAPAEQSASKKWYTTGREGFEQKAHADAVAEEKRKRGAARFYLKSKSAAAKKPERNPNEFGAFETKARVVFLDSGGFFVKEHSLQVNGSWGHRFTCTGDREPCPICQQLGDTPSIVGYWTIVDTRKWRKKDGTVSNYRRSLFGAKGPMLELIDEMIDEKGGEEGNIRGVVAEIKRIGDKESNTGGHLKVLGRISEEKIQDKFITKEFPDTATKYDYPEKLAPPTKDEYRQIGVTLSGGVGSDEDVEYEDPEDDFDLDDDEKDEVSDDEMDDFLD